MAVTQRRASARFCFFGPGSQMRDNPAFAPDRAASFCLLSCQTPAPPHCHRLMQLLQARARA